SFFARRTTTTRWRRTKSKNFSAARSAAIFAGRRRPSSSRSQPRRSARGNTEASAGRLGSRLRRGSLRRRHVSVESFSFPLSHVWPHGFPGRVGRHRDQLGKAAGPRGLPGHCHGLQRWPSAHAFVRQPEEDARGDESQASGARRWRWDGARKPKHHRHLACKATISWE
ncbi:unnamed protein product, partial [Amoebophrya sp. A120]